MTNPATQTSNGGNHVDVLIVGAGLSGIGAATHLQNNCPGKSYTILEARDAIGGTWDLFKYPGIRSDSDMFTLGYNFRPWEDDKSIADGPTILNYIRDTAKEMKVEDNIRFNHKVRHAAWSTQTARWTITAERTDTGETVEYTANFMFMASGYYNYDAGYTPDFEGTEDFKGRIVHPQKWTDDIDYAGKKVIVIGSGATAVTLVPEMAKTAEHVTMLQRSPTYMGSVPAKDKLANKLRDLLPAKVAYAMTRWRKILFGLGFFNFSRSRPEVVKKVLLKGVSAQLKDQSLVEKHFTPSYNPWDQRLCAVTDGDLFKMINKGKATVVTDHIDRFNETGILTKGGEQLDADLIITATGLDLQMFGGMTCDVDGAPIAFNETYAYKGMMFSGVPNFAQAFGYTNASWTLKCDLTCAYVCRLINHMDAKGLDYCVPEQNDPNFKEEAFLDFSSGYVQRAAGTLPKQGAEAPWKVYQNYFKDKKALGKGKLEDDVMTWGTATGEEAKLAAE
ncbi:MAG: flavin-containing monooxygenase [Alphaproteobacteria bacterium]